MEENVDEKPDAIGSTLLEVHNSLVKQNILTKLEQTEKKKLFGRTNFIPLKTSPANLDDTCNVILVKVGSSNCQQGIGTLIARNPNEDAGALELITTFVAEAMFWEIEVKNYHNASDIILSFLVHPRAKNEDFYYALAAVVKNMNNIFPETEMIIGGVDTKKFTTIRNNKRPNYATTFAFMSNFQNEEKIMKNAEWRLAISLEKMKNFFHEIKT